MIFSSYPFLLLFLPAVYAGFLLLRQFRLERPAVGMLLLASLVFYAVWDWHYLAVLLGSILGNFLLGRRLACSGNKAYLVTAVVANLALLGYFKYAGFFFGFLSGAEGWRILLPLGISFFTFQQIAWQVDIYRKRLPGAGDFLDYCFFIAFFPQLIAGPIVHARTLLPQIARGWFQRPLTWQVGLALLTVGLMKKVLLADPLAPGVDALFARAEQGEALAAPDALLAGLAYGLQLYFDFSGYADMALGLGLMFGIRLPANFRSPYKSASVVEFWRRWHITLSQFLRDYLYIPLGGNRKGRWRASVNLLITMLLGGLWHGAGWQFIAWGALHGLLLVINHGWRRRVPWRMPKWMAVTVTLLAVMLAWIPFRAESLSTALHIYSGLAVWQWTAVFNPGVMLAEILALRIDASLPWVCLGLLAFVLSAPGSRELCLRLNGWARGLLVGGGLLLVLKALAGQPDRAFLYFNF